MYNGVLKVSKAMLQQLVKLCEEYDILSYNTLVKKLSAISTATAANTKSLRKKYRVWRAGANGGDECLCGMYFLLLYLSLY